MPNHCQFKISVIENSTDPLILESRDYGFENFRIDDPFNLRKAIVPLFVRDMAGHIQGMGTAFHFDGWGNFLTADHVVDFLREYPKNSTQITEATLNTKGTHACIMLGSGISYGHRVFATDCVRLIERSHSILYKKENPILEIRGEIQTSFINDISVIKVFDYQNIPAKFHPKIIRIKANGDPPKIGDTVLAMGFPDIHKRNEKPDPNFIDDTLIGGFGIITGFPQRGNEPPAIETTCNWPSGMSGGPVFDRNGNVIGIVSKSFEGTPTDPGNGLATFLRTVVRLEDLVPTLDTSNPGWRRGYILYNQKNGNFVSIHENQSDAFQALDKIYPTEYYKVSYGSNKIGSNEFVI